jgi:hypothetical protein
MQFSAAKAGVILFPFSLLSALIAKFVLPSLMQKLSIGQTGVWGMSLMVTDAVFLLCSLLFAYHLAFLLLSVACVSGLGMAICFTSLSVISAQDVRSSIMG